MKLLPALISIPHGGSRIPAEVRDRVNLTPEALFADMDPFTREIYNLGRSVMEVVMTDVARAIVDLNRAPSELPPDHPDGVIKIETCMGVRIYKDGTLPDKRLIRKLLELYYEPYHRRLKKASQRPELRLALDCHSMHPVGPPHAPDAGKERPLFCLSNANGFSAPDSMLKTLRDCFCTAFQVDPDQVRLNQPFKGGYIIRTYGMKPVPWIQVQMNRNLYLAPPYYDERHGEVDRGRLKELNRCFETALSLYFKRHFGSEAFDEQEE